MLLIIKYGIRDLSELYASELGSSVELLDRGSTSE